MDFQYRVSIIVPIYNQEPYLEEAVGSLLNQTIPSSDMEIILVDDGSTDNSPEMCDSLSQRYSNIVVVHKMNGGLSDARNCGIDHAHGKYLMFLDGDDKLAADTVLPVVNFFDQHYDEVDLVTYPCLSEKAGVIAPLEHYRYSTLTDTGIYDLQDSKNIYAAITQMYICVKNMPDHNVLFSTDRDFRHEDQRYCIDIILNKLKIGFCNEGAYIYNKNPEGLTGSKFYSYYLFEKTMTFWEEEFAKFPSGDVPQYLQALYVSDLSWKLRANILFPYHYEQEKFSAAVGRIDKLLQQVDVEVIANHPGVSRYHVPFFLKRKVNKPITCLAKQNALALTQEDKLVYAEEGIEAVLLRTKMVENGFRITGYLRSPCFEFGEKPVLRIKRKDFRTINDERPFLAEEIVPLCSTSWDYFWAKIKTNTFWGFQYETTTNCRAELEFLVDVNGYTHAATFVLESKAIFSSELPERYLFIKNNIEYSLNENVITIRKLSGLSSFLTEQENELFQRREPRRSAVRAAAKALQQRKKNIWLYYDCEGAEKDNAYAQFVHDYDTKDGIERYYVIHDPLETRKHLFTQEQLRNVVSFGSAKHKLLFLAAVKIITAYIESANWIPFLWYDFKYYSDLFNAEVIYLQHSILHARLPWKYSFDRLLIDKEIVSTQFEIDNLCTNYCFEPQNLIPVGMPRYGFLNTNSIPQKKILLAPSWRSYLVKGQSDTGWIGVPSIFKDSIFYKELNAFLTNKRLAEMLRNAGYTLELKLHPIFKPLYANFFSFDSPEIRLAANSVNEEDYQIFITDYSSYRFDFVYLKRAILYFFPDEEQFRSGMNSFWETDLPLDGQFGDLVHTADELISLIEETIKRGGEPREEYAQQMEGFFLHYDNNQCGRIYEALITM